MQLFDKILGRETRAQLVARAQSEAHFAEMLQCRAQRLQAALDLVIAEGHFRNSDGRLLAKGKLPTMLREKLGLD